MPIIKSAKKKLKQDKKRRAANLKYKEAYKKAVKEVKKAAGATPKKIGELVKKGYSAIDKATKVGIIHKNRASRLKSQIAKATLKGK